MKTQSKKLVATERPIQGTIKSKVNDENNGKIKSFRDKNSFTEKHSLESQKDLLRRSGSSTASISNLVRRSQLSKTVRQTSLGQFEQSTKYPSYIASTDWDLEKWVVRDKVFKDYVDWSRHPSFTIRNIAYHLECEQRYLTNTKKYNEQLQREMKNFIASKIRVCEQYFTKRILSYATFWPPLHTRPEIDIFTKKFFQLTPPEKKRLNFLMNTDLSFI